MEYEIEVVGRTLENAAVVRGKVRREEIGEFIGGAIGEIMRQRLLLTGPMFARTFSAGEVLDMEVGFPVAQPTEILGRIEPAVLPAGDVATTMHVGPWEELGNAYRALEAWFETSGYERTGAPWETYLDGPDVAQPRTMVSWPCRPTD